MRKLSRSAIAAVLLTSLAFCGRANAWAEAGHRIIASLAFRQLPAADQERFAGWLRAHPRFEEDFKAFMPPSLAEADQTTRNEWLFQQAAIWPDMVRGLPDDKKPKYNNPTWHYIDIPSFLTEGDRKELEGKITINNSLDLPAPTGEEMNAIQAIRTARKQLTDPAVSDADKGVALCWLLHVVGDIHQPLHSTAMFSVKLFPDGDKGGNSVSTQQGFSLHGLWDTFPGDWITFSDARKRATELAGQAEYAEIRRAAAGQLDDKTWLEESRQLCTTSVYTPEVISYLRAQKAPTGRDRLPPIRLSEEYLIEGSKISTSRIVQAGYRLGGILAQLSNSKAP